ncbi:MAG: VanW family protein [Clostridia bacterium]|nr:VanW family protein [Clostridia bacterium]
MKKRFFFLLVILILALGAQALAQDIVYTGSVSKKMTIRQKKSTSAAKVGSVKEGETINIIEYGKEWTLVEKDGKTGYVLTKNVVDLALADGYDDASDAVYLGRAEKELTIRREKSKSALRMQTLGEDETVYILELGKEWHKVIKQGILGYVLASGIVDIEAACEGVEVPQEFIPAPPFTAVYKAMADVNLSIRRHEDADSRLLGTVYEKEYVDVMDVGEEWAHVKKGDAEGYVRAGHLRYFERYDPYGPYVPGTVWYPYAAKALEDTQIIDAQSGELLQIAPKGSIMAVSALDEQFAVSLPYDRITGSIRATGNLEFETVRPWNEAMVGDLVAVFSTYYDPTQKTQEQIGRLHNIMQGVERLQNVVIAQGEKFSFNDYCAPYTLSNGYMEGPIINYVSSDKLGPGGGICQVSTTLYNAILQIPMEVVKWQVHSSYGIEYAPLDFDAAVGAGNIDLRLRNTLPYDVKMVLQAEGGVLTVRLYREG